MSDKGFKKRDLIKAFYSGMMSAMRPNWQRASYGGKDIYTALSGDWIAIGRDISRVTWRENEKAESKAGIHGKHKD